MHSRLQIATLLMLGVVVAASLAIIGGAHAATQDAASQDAARAALLAVFNRRADLHAVFADDWTVTSPRIRDAGMLTLEDWARRYGFKEHPDQLGWYAPVPTGPLALAPKAAPYAPVRSTKGDYSYKGVTAEAVYVVDVATHQVLLAKNADKPHPLASITKLMTATVALDNAVDMGKIMAIQQSDEVGGARLRLEDGKPLTVRQIFDAMLIGSANNCAVAMSRSTALTKEEFVAAMNARARRVGLSATSFVDPSGIEVDNTSTARDVAALAIEAFALPDVRRATTTAKLEMQVAGETHTIKNTNGLLTDPNNGLWVQGGKTGYLIESRWNLAVQMQDYRRRPLMVVVLGSSSQAQSFKDAAAVAKWTWANYRWVASVAQK